MKKSNARRSTPAVSRKSSKAKATPASRVSTRKASVTRTKSRTGLTAVAPRARRAVARVKRAVTNAISSR